MSTNALLLLVGGESTGKKKYLNCRDDSQAVKHKTHEKACSLYIAGRLQFGGLNFFQKHLANFNTFFVSLAFA